MIKNAWVVLVAVLFLGCNSGPSQTAENTVGGANVVSAAQTPLTKEATSLSLDWGKKGQPGQIAVADVLSYSGSKPKISPPEGWRLIRDDSSQTTRQSLYWHAIQANDSSTATWTFSEPVDAQGAVVLLDSVATDAPVDMTTGNSGNGGTVTAKSVATTADGDLILAFYATDFGGPGLGPTMPTDVNTVVNQEATSHEYWILANYQSQNGNTEDAATSTGQSFHWVGAQVAIKKGSTSASPQ